MNSNIKKVINYIQELYNSKNVSLHAPVFLGNEKKYLLECVDSTFVSSVGMFVDRFEEEVAAFTGAKSAIAVVNGTNALQAALHLAGVKADDEVITQPLTFIATCNAVRYLGAYPVFVDVDRDTLGLSPVSLLTFLEKFGKKENGKTINRETGKNISACVPMHTFGHPVRIKELVEICSEWNIPLVEDAAESIGSYTENKHTGLFGVMGILSFNGNKTITTGGGGMIITNNPDLAKRAKHITTTAKVSHPWEFNHDELGYNFRMPNINAALGCAQMEMLEKILVNKRETARIYYNFFKSIPDMDFIFERPGTTCNFWLNSVLLKNRFQRDLFLTETNKSGVITRPIWTLMYRLPMYKDCLKIETPNAEYLEERIVNIPSGVRV